MLLPQLLPDEFIRGHLGRLLVLNALHKTDARAALTRWFRHRHWPYAPNLEALDLLLVALGIDAAQVRVEHTMVPYLVELDRLDPPVKPHLRTGSPRRLNELAQRAAMLCPECVKEDEGFWGFSYWRRRHQVPWAMSCDKHGAGLRRADPSAFYDLPSKAVPLSSKPLHLRTSMKEHAIHQRIFEESLEQARRELKQSKNVYPPIIDPSRWEPQGTK